MLDFTVIDLVICFLRFSCIGPLDLLIPRFHCLGTEDSLNPNLLGLGQEIYSSLKLSFLYFAHEKAILKILMYPKML